ncbi:hypothetical protein [Streptomyces hainanensis]|uniref:Tetratricopeptide repeat protein n=1 Tax=Streptomyces hainanensis TaxID=402648 RepID=A0A4R4TNN5_9ACTN|nr:hypothetical protein [Streptomyces hainanensis]TDC77504.1 hypothetical protein E1283_07140 [Streptomyces hainanensis]
MTSPDENDLGGPAADAVRAASYERLAVVAALLYRQVGGLPPVGLEMGELVAASGMPDLAAGAVEDLVVCGLLRRRELVGGSVLYRMDCAAREHAAGLAEVLDPAGERVAVGRRWVEYLLAGALAARAVLTPSAPPERVLLRHPLPGPRVVFDGAVGALAWLASHQDSVAAAVPFARELGWNDVAWRLLVAAWPVAQRRRNHAFWLPLLVDHGLPAAGCAGDDQAERYLLSLIGEGWLHEDQPAEALACFEDMLAGARQQLDERDVAVALLGLGQVQLQVGRQRPAMSSLRRAADIFGSLGERHGLGRSLILLGGLAATFGEPEEDVQLLSRAVDLLGECREVYDMARARAHLGLARARRGAHVAASTALLQARAEFAASGALWWEARSVEWLAAASRRQLGNDGTRHLRNEAVLLYALAGSPDAARLRAMDARRDALTP